MQVSLPKIQRLKLAALAARTGTLRCLKLLHIWGFPMGGTWEAAAKEGHLDTLRWLGRVWPAGRGDVNVIECATESGHLDCVSFLFSINARRGKWITSSAARAGHLACLVFLVEAGCPVHIGTPEAAAANGHIDCLHYLHARGCPWGEWTVIRSAASGHLDCLRFAVERGCPVAHYAFVLAVERGKRACLEYLLERGFRPDKPLQLRRSSDAQLDCLRLAASYGLDVSPGQSVLAASVGNLRVVRYFHSAGFPLWHRAVEGPSCSFWSHDRSWRNWVFYVSARATMTGDGPESSSVWDGVLHVPPWEGLLPACWATLRFGALHGAPLTPKAEALVRERRACAQEVVRCFHAARWLAATGRRSSAKWKAISAVPNEVLMIILEMAEVEIQEALH
jgi:hypothetical protein